MSDNRKPIAEAGIFATETTYAQMHFSVLLDDYRKSIEDDDIIAEREARDTLWKWVLSKSQLIVEERDNILRSELGLKKHIPYGGKAPGRE